MELAYVFASIVLLVLLISWGKVQPFLAFLVASSVAAILLGLPIDKVPGVLEKGVGNILGGLLGIVCIGAMFGKLVAEQRRGAEDRHGAHARVRREAPHLGADVHRLPGRHPAVLQRGFVLLVPLVFSVVQQTKVPPIYLGIPMFASLSVTHGFLPPHPGAHRHAAHVRRRHRHHAVLRTHRRAAGDDHRRARYSRGCSAT